MALKSLIEFGIIHFLFTLILPTVKPQKAINEQTIKHGAFHCRHCGMEHVRGLRRANHKNLPRLQEDVLLFLKDAVSKNLIGPGAKFQSITREAVAAHFEVPEHQIDQVFQNLKVAGLMGTGYNEPPHDSTRERLGGGDSSWIGTLYPVRADAIKQLIAQDAEDSKAIGNNPRRSRRP